MSEDPSIYGDIYGITQSSYLGALDTDGVAAERDFELLDLLESAPRCSATAPQLAQLMGYSSFPPVNAQIGRLGKRMAQALGIDIPERANNSPGWWRVVALGEPTQEGFTWTLQPELRAALRTMGRLSDQNSHLYPDQDIPSDLSGLKEGAVRKVGVNAYERNRLARELCIRHYGSKCSVCDFDFGKAYGEHGKGFIHVHHLVEISTIGQEYRVDPINDLRPVCVDCHPKLTQGFHPILTRVMGVEYN